MENYEVIETSGTTYDVDLPSNRKSGKDSYAAGVVTGAGGLAGVAALIYFATKKKRLQKQRERDAQLAEQIKADIIKEWGLGSKEVIDE